MSLGLTCANSLQSHDDLVKRPRKEYADVLVLVITEAPHRQWQPDDEARRA